MSSAYLVEKNLYTAAQVQELDRLAIVEYGIPGIQLMKRAGGAVLDVLLECWPAPELITVYCGVGNNGGDGYIVAALAAQQNIPVQVIQVGDKNKLSGDALRASNFAAVQGVKVLSFNESVMPMSGVVVDALLGTGLNGDVRAPFQTAIQQINQAGLPVVAVDIPSGLNSDTGAICGVGVSADLTVSFIGLKRGLFTSAGPEQCGEIFFDDLSVPKEIYSSVKGKVEKLDLEYLLPCLKPRSRNTHKGHFGHVLIVGGDHGYGGAALMAAETAARCGAGLTSVATRGEHVSSLLARRPEIMAHGVETHHQLLTMLDRASVIVIGPGLGVSAWSEQMLYHTVQHAITRNLPLVMDADALNLLAEGHVVSKLSSQTILTPHPGEAARLLNCSVAEIQQDRFAATTALQQKYQATIILKGAGSLIGKDQSLSLCPYGNPGMASGGMGDVLSGVLGALLAQHLLVTQAAQLGVCVHARAADILAEREGERGLLATDLILIIRGLLNVCA